MRVHGIYRLGGLLGPFLLGCGGRSLEPVMPTGSTPGGAVEAESWVRASQPKENRLYRFKWQFIDSKGAAGGRGSGRVGVPDSLRFDVQGSLGVGRAAAFIVGDTAIWAEPEEDVAKLVPSYPLLWAMLGVPRLPSRGATLRRFQDERVEAWQFANGVDTIEYVRTNAPTPRLIADVRQGMKRIGRVETVLNPDGSLVSSRLTVPAAPARLDITFTLNSVAKAFAPETWVRPQP